jgi:hypothetical protein
VVGLFAVVALTACGGAKGELLAEPASLDFGVIDFQQEVPSEGLNPQELALTNDTDAELLVEITGFDADHLCIPGVDAAPSPITTLAAGESYSLFVGVCGYDSAAGERDSLVEGLLVFDAEGLEEALEVPWSFTPVRSI